MDASDWIALGALIVSVIALAVGFWANRHAKRSANASERSAVAAETSAREAVRANELQAEANVREAAASAAAVRRGLPTRIVRVNGRSVDGKSATVELPVENKGGWYRDVVVISDWEDAPVEPPVLQTGGSG